MAIVKEYIKNGKKYYKFQVYVGVDPSTGKKRRTTRRNFPTKKQAETALRKLQVEIDEGIFEKRSYETYQDYYDLWVEQYRKKGIRESTYIRTTNMFKNRILPLLGHMRIKQISIHECQKCVNQWFDEMTSYRKVKGYASTIFTYAMTLDAIQKNPMDLVTMPMRLLKPNEEENKNFYTKDQVLHFLECVKSENSLMIYSFFRILVWSGCRQGEALALTWEDIDFKNGTIRIRKSLSRGLDGLVINATKTRSSMREISIDPETLAILKRWKSLQKKELRVLGTKPKKDQLLFHSTTNDLLQNTRPRKWLVKILKKYDLPQISIHGFRHTHSSLLLEAGAQLIDVKDKLGHSSIKTTADIYSHITDQKREKTAALFQAHLSPEPDLPHLDDDNLKYWLFEYAKHDIAKTLLSIPKEQLGESQQRGRVSYLYHNYERPRNCISSMDKQSIGELIRHLNHFPNVEHELDNFKDILTNPDRFTITTDDQIWLKKQKGEYKTMQDDILTLGILDVIIESLRAALLTVRKEYKIGPDSHLSVDDINLYFHRMAM